MKWLTAAVLSAALLAAGAPQTATLFEAGAGGYWSFRIPALAMTAKGTLLAFCAARKQPGDWADIDIALRRSTDGGRTWSPMRIIADRGSMTVDNPTPIAGRNGAVHFLYQVNYAQLYYMRSDDEGRTFSAPVDITEAAHKFRCGWVPEKPETSYGWNVVAPGPGHGIQLAGGRLLVPIWMSPHYRHRPSRTATIFSDDGGKTWKAGALIPQASVNPLGNPSEHVALEVADGRVMTNLRNESQEHRRATAYSPDGISNWTVPELRQELFEPVCMASLIRVSSPPKRRNRVVFANPETLPRNDLRVRLSYDEGKTWPHSKLLLAGPTGYSDMAAAPDGTVYILYERAVPAEKKISLLLTRFGVDWLTDGIDRFE